MTLDWKPSSAFSANLKLDYNRQRSETLLGFTDIFCGGDGLPDPSVLAVFGVSFAPTHNCNINDSRFPTPDGNAAINVVPTGTVGADRADISQAFNDTDIFFGRLNFDVDLSDSLTFSSVSGIMKLDSVDFDSYSYVGVGPAFNPNGAPVGAIAPTLAAINTPGRALGMGSSDPRNKTDQYSQEFGLSSDYDGSFNFKLGAFYEWRELDFDTAQQAVNISIIAPDPITGNTYDYFKKHKTKTDTVSLFGSIYFDITDQLELAGGLRWTKENKTNTITVPYVHRFLGPGPAFIGSGFFSGPIKFRDTNVSPEVSLRYKATDDISIYAAYKTGFKSGGIDNSALPSNSLSQAALTGNFGSLIYKSETAKGGELGAKMQFANRSITLNLSGFNYVFKNLQLQNFNSTTVQFVTFNASELTSRGVDLDFAWRTPIEGLNFSGGMAYTSAKFTDDLFIGRNPDPALPAGVTNENLRGRDVSRAPKFAGNIAFDWTAEVSDGLAFGLNGNMAYSSSYWTANNSNFTIEERRFGDFKQKGYVTFDGSVSISDPDKKWKLALIGVNLTNKTYVLTSGTRPFAAPAGGLGVPGSATFVPQGDDLVVNMNRGRQLFVEASFKF